MIEEYYFAKKLEVVSDRDAEWILDMAYEYSKTSFKTALDYLEIFEKYLLQGKDFNYIFEKLDR